MSSSLSAATTSSSPSPSTSPSAGNTTNTLDNIIVSPKPGETLLYGSEFPIEWNATTNGDTYVFYRSLLPSPSSDIAIPTCQNLQSIPGTMMTCPWTVLPSSLPSVTTQGFEVVLSWNGSTKGSTHGTQVSLQFGIYNGTNPTIVPGSIEATRTSATRSVFASSEITPTTSMPPNSIAQAEHAMSEKIGLGVGLGVGISLIAVLIATCFLLRWRCARANTGNSAEQPQENIDLPAWRSTRLAKAIFSSDNKNLGAAELLENYRNAEHFGFIPSSPSR